MKKIIRRTISINADFLKVIHAVIEMNNGESQISTSIELYYYLEDWDDVCSGEWAEELMLEALDIVCDKFHGKRFQYKIRVDISATEKVRHYIVNSGTPLPEFEKVFKQAVLKELKPHHAGVLRRVEHAMRRLLNVVYI